MPWWFVPMVVGMLTVIHLSIWLQVMQDRKIQAREDKLQREWEEMMEKKYGVKRASGV